MFYAKHHHELKNLDKHRCVSSPKATEMTRTIYQTRLTAHCLSLPASHRIPPEDHGKSKAHEDNDRHEQKTAAHREIDFRLKRKNRQT